MTDAGHSIALDPIVIVEDNDMNAQLLRHQLRRLGFGATAHFADAEDALDWLQNHPCLLIFTDWQMFPVDGAAFVRRYRRWESARDLRRLVIAVTASAMACDYESCLNAGADDCLRKPLSLGELSGTLKKWGIL